MLNTLKSNTLLVAGLLVIFCAIGIGRFSFGMLLPSTQAGLNASIFDMGFISGLNFVGYLLALFIYERVARILGEQKLIFTSMIFIALSFFTISSIDSVQIIGFIYFFTGVATSFANVAITVLVVNAVEIQRRGKALGVMVMGSGFAILLGGNVVPMLQDWRDGWLFFGVVVVVAICVVAFLLPKQEVDHTHHKSLAPKVSWKKVFDVGLVYMLSGMTLAVFVTFFVASITFGGASEAEAGKLWMLFGFCSLFSGVIFGVVSDRIGRIDTLMIIFILQGFALLLQVYHLPFFVAILMGICAWSVPSVVSALCGDMVAKEQIGLFFARVTILFGIGQMSGPVLAGVVVEYFGSYSQIFLACVVVSFGCAILIRRLKLPSA